MHDSAPYKRSLSHGYLDEGDNNADSASASGRRSKRLKRDNTNSSSTTNGENTPQRSSSTVRCRGKSSTRKIAVDKVCETCGKPDRKLTTTATTATTAATASPNLSATAWPSTLLICDSCDNGYHMSCLDPPLETMPEHDWHCARCLVGTGEYGFEDGEVYSLREFQEKANKFRREYFANHMSGSLAATTVTGTSGEIKDGSGSAKKKAIPFDPVHPRRDRKSLSEKYRDQREEQQQKQLEIEEEVEAEFWRLLQNVEETTEVEYGADIHCTTHGSAFPTPEKNPLDPYSTDGWNLNVLPLYGESLFKHIKTDISGMTVPWAYVGMMFSTFCWHNEDHYAYSANYQHFGATKTWYGVPGEQTEAFEEAMRQHVPELFETQPDLLFQLVTLLPPDRLEKAGVDVYALDQRAGEFVITFPRAYHAGFNHGFNFNEAVNFAPTDWEPFGEMGAVRLREYRRQPCFSHDELLCTAAARDASIKTAKWLGPALRRLEEREMQERKGFRGRQEEVLALLSTDEERGKAQARLGAFVLRDGDLLEEEYQCSYCKVFSYLTQFRCEKSGTVLCLLHAETYDCCSDSLPEKLLGITAHTLYYRMTDAQISELTQRICDRAEIPERWAAKLDTILSESPRPSLKALQSLVSEGEKIPYALQGLTDLTDFVAQCNRWVNKATNYITRKQQNRRKNERAWRRSVGARSASAAAAAAATPSSSSAVTLMLSDERDFRDTRTVDDLRELLAEGEKLSFDCPQITALQEKLDEVEEFQREATAVLQNPYLSSSADVEQMVDSGEELGIPEGNEHLQHFKDLYLQGQAWEDKAAELIRMEVIHYQQLDALSVQAGRIPVSDKTLHEVKTILSKQREAENQIRAINEATKHPDLSQRPLYKDVRDLMESLVAMNSKPPGFIDLEREKKRHEDWMRKGKKLFGKGNAPLHILKMHMQYVVRKNSYCFDLEDQFRPPVEPPSREASPDAVTDAHQYLTGKAKSKDVFCLCRQPESGLMIECGVCHEWYHGKCLKIARGKFKEDDEYTCPICDWRVKIPRDAARPKLEDLIRWQDEIPDLPFQPEEQEILQIIVDQACAFRNFVAKFTRGEACVTIEELPTMKFYLRKIEGAEIMLAYETNHFRRMIHHLQPIAKEGSPPPIEQSLSTRKPRPTKQQKLMKDYNVDKPEDLPLEVRRQFQAANKRKSTEMQRSTSRTSNSIPPPPAPSHGAPQLQLHPMEHARSLSEENTVHGLPSQLSLSHITNPGGIHSPAPYPFPPAFTFGAPEDAAHFPPVSSGFYQHISASSALGGPPDDRQSNYDPGLFSPTSFAGHEASLRRASGMVKDDVDDVQHHHHQELFVSNPHENMDDIFADFTNQDDDDRQEDEMEQVEIGQPNEAQEALEALGKHDGFDGKGSDIMTDMN
ncbi:PHD transcription factor [Ascosphaera apis ARSEF 7405]|uniref:PHD transcription factor n=1 Tax=Ascosphaera apis ARSEF 7405 TaxID=392613 RepID=A0A162IB29_9EURO|nr:PHD transcription factor [Ascosphaera apis ARSEF 7405]